MAYKIIIDPNANLDIIESIDWYNNAQAGLGLKFYKQILVSFDIIINTPFAFPVRYKTNHTALVKKFPFMVHYLIDSEKNAIVITAVLHTSRDQKAIDIRPSINR